MHEEVMVNKNVLPTACYITSFYEYADLITIYVIALEEK